MKRVNTSYEYERRDTKMCAVIGICNILDAIDIGRKGEFMPISPKQRLDILKACILCEMEVDNAIV